jgi:23S rRNA pseudouridine2604 synthase
VDTSISLNKYISDTGYCSRREADQLILAGRVLLNNKPAQPGNRFKPGDIVEVDGSYITAPKKEKLLYIAFNKPIGITTTSETHIPGNIISYINFPKRIFPIGRLDKDSEGLILLTNDGNIVNKILRADNQHEKEYIVRINKPVGHDFVHRMSASMPILGTNTLPCKVNVTGRQTFRITLTQGLNRQIRRMCEYLGYNVVSLQRIRIMNIKLDKLAAGKWRYLSDVETEQLHATIEAPVATARVAPPRPKVQKKNHADAKPLPVKSEKLKPDSYRVKSKKADSKTNTPPGKKDFKKSGEKNNPAADPVVNRSKSSTSFKEFRKKGRRR